MKKYIITLCALAILTPSMSLAAPIEFQGKTYEDEKELRAHLIEVIKQLLVAQIKMSETQTSLTSVNDSHGLETEEAILSTYKDESRAAVDRIAKICDEQNGGMFTIATGETTTGIIDGSCRDFIDGVTTPFPSQARTGLTTRECTAHISIDGVMFKGSLCSM